jgi:hypothetical protein
MNGPAQLLIPNTVTQTCQLAWTDTIHAGMARIRHLKSTYNTVLTKSGIFIYTTYGI